MNRRAMLSIKGLILLVFGVWLFVSCGRGGGKLKFDDHKSEEEWKTALLQQVPTGSSMNDVIGFLKENEVPQRSAESSCGYLQIDTHLINLGICKGTIQYEVWWIEFHFDNNAQLRDISVGLYP